jgi:hypothetical protein
MNEQIRELVKRAGGHFSTHNLMSNPVQHRESVELWDDRIEKFAELIVQEMLVTCEEHPAWTGRMIGEQIKQHFGVEE